MIWMRTSKLGVKWDTPCLHLVCATVQFSHQFSSELLVQFLVLLALLASSSQPMALVLPVFCSCPTQLEVDEHDLQVPFRAGFVILSPKRSHKHVPQGQIPMPHAGLVNFRQGLACLGREITDESMIHLFSPAQSKARPAVYPVASPPKKQQASNHQFTVLGIVLQYLVALQLHRPQANRNIFALQTVEASIESGFSAHFPEIKGRKALGEENMSRCAQPHLKSGRSPQQK